MSFKWQVYSSLLSLSAVKRCNFKSPWIWEFMRVNISYSPLTGEHELLLRFSLISLNKQGDTRYHMTRMARRKWEYLATLSSEFRWCFLSSRRIHSNRLRRQIAFYIAGGVKMKTISALPSSNFQSVFLIHARCRLLTIRENISNYKVFYYRYAVQRTCFTLKYEIFWSIVIIYCIYVHRIS